MEQTIFKRPKEIFRLNIEDTIEHFIVSGEYTDFLTIAIPTFNRAQKLLRLLKNIETNILESGLSGQINVFISDNASTDITPEVVKSFKPSFFNLTYVRHKHTLGNGELNFFYLYSTIKSKYIWLFGDDDLLLPGAIKKVYDNLKIYNPDVLVFSFIQPPGNTKRTFNFTKNVEIITNPEMIIDLLSKCPKISIYVLKKISFSDEENERVKNLAFTTGYCFVDMSYTIMAHSESPKLCVISEPLATCDEDFIKISAPPEVWGGFWKVFLNPFVVRYKPNLAYERLRFSYYTLIDILYAFKTGVLKSDDTNFTLTTIQTVKHMYDRAIRELKWEIYWLLKKPKYFIKFLLLKANLTSLNRFYKKCKGWLKFCF